MAGVPSKISPLLTAKIIYAVEHSLPYDMAAWYSGICEKTLYNWLNQGIKDRDAGQDTEHSQFLQAIKKAEVEKVLQLNENITCQTERWQASAWMLERRWRQYFGQDAGIIQELKAAFEEFKANQSGNVLRPTLEKDNG